MEEISRIPPNSEEAELCVLGSILIDNDAVLAVSEFLRAEHFYNSNYGKIYQSMMDLYEERMPLDLVTVSEKLKNKILRDIPLDGAYVLKGTLKLIDLKNNKSLSKNTYVLGF